MITDPMWALLEPRLEPTGLHACGAKPRLPDRRSSKPSSTSPAPASPGAISPATPAPGTPSATAFAAGSAAAACASSLRASPTTPNSGPSRVRSSIPPSCAPTRTPPEPREKKRLGPERSAEVQGLGRCRGGNASKVIVGATDEDTVVDFDVVPAQRHDAPPLKPLLKKAMKRVPEIEEVVGDRGFDGQPQRQACFDLGTMPQIPGKSTGPSRRRSTTKPTARGTGSSASSRR